MDKETFQATIDEWITKWRDIRDNGSETRPDLSIRNTEGYSPADCYVDAYQCIRKAVLGDTLK